LSSDRAASLGFAGSTDGKIASLDFKALCRTFSSALRAKGVDERRARAANGHGGSTVTARNYTAQELAVLGG